jgi:hypothetical protein
MFLYYCSQRHNFSTISKSFSACEANFWNLTYVEEFSSGNQNGRLVQDGVIFGKKSTFVKADLVTISYFFFNL